MLFSQHGLDDANIIYVLCDVLIQCFHMTQIFSVFMNEKTVYDKQMTTDKYSNSYEAQSTGLHRYQRNSYTHGL